MKHMKYLLVGAFLLGMATTVTAQDVQSQVANITNVINANKGNLKAVEAQVKEFYKANKKNAEALVGLGRAYLNVQDTTYSSKYANEAIKRDKNYAPGYILLGDIEVVKDNGGAAAGWYLQAINFAPQDPLGYIKYAGIYRGVSPDESVSKLEELRKVLPDYPVDAEAGHLYYLSNRFDKAVEYYDKADKAKMNAGQLAEYAFAAYLSGNPQKSLEVSSYGVQRYPRHAALNRLTFYNNTDLKNYDEALTYGDRLFNASDSAKISALDYKYYGHAYSGANALDKAIEMFKKSLEQDPKSIDLYKQIAEAYSGLGDFDNAISYYNQYMEKNDKLSTSDYIALARIYMAQGDKVTGQAKTEALKKADKVYEELGQKAPSNIEYATYMRARVNSLMDPETTEGLAKPFYDDYARRVEAHPTKSEADKVTLVEAYSYLGYYYYLKNDKATSDSYWKKILEIDPENATAKAALGMK